MGLFGRRRTPTEAELGTGTPLRVVAVDGQTPSLVRWNRERWGALDSAQPTLRVLRAAGIEGDVDLRSRGRDESDGEVRLPDGGAVRFVVDIVGSSRLVTERGRDDEDVVGYLDTARPEPLDPQTALGDVAFAMSSLVVHEGGAPVQLPPPLTVTTANLQLLEPADGLPARWCVCIFVTRAHEVPADADAVRREELWVEHSVGVKLHLDGTVALDPHDDDPDGTRSRESLATAQQWAGAPVDLVPYARWLADATAARLGRTIPGL
ncbi:hypothetical protein GXB85_04995 [Cellulomonas sp. APG4]|uniref:hypothetical protein n=1 Tax=Cellulomonas sp. APG4 TaxID=1538656 RepID=UPI001379E94A|nr:hypothetical protein [Cellulomonas sp. APG4]NCT90309.1 hypothetical protein [Cellulomonas sp. APG4]